MENLDLLFFRVRTIAGKHFDGHFSILKFTTNYKGLFGTIDLDGLTGRDYVRSLPGFPTLQDALEYMIKDIPHQDGDYIAHIIRGVQIKGLVEEAELDGRIK